MTFENAIRTMLAHCAETLTSKRKEYAIGDDFHNFTVAAELQGCSRKKALAGMMSKHVVSVFDMAGATEVFPLEMWEEKIGDNINYLLLLWAMVCKEQAEPVADPEEVDADPEQEEPKPPQKKPAKKNKRNTVDHGKICACYKAGWTVDKIADEVGCTGNTVRYHLQKEGLMA